jgi:hypothetical protein
MSLRNTRNHKLPVALRTFYCGFSPVLSSFSNLLRGLSLDSGILSIRTSVLYMFSSASGNLRTISASAGQTLHLTNEQMRQVAGRATNQSIICKLGTRRRAEMFSAAIGKPPALSRRLNPSLLLEGPHALQVYSHQHSQLEHIGQIFGIQASTSLQTYSKATMSHQDIQQPSFLGIGGQKRSSAALGYPSTHSSGTALKFP